MRKAIILIVSWKLDKFMRMQKNIFLLILFSIIPVYAQLPSIDIANAVFLSASHVTQPCIKLIAERYPNKQDYPPLLKTAGTICASPYTITLSFVLIKVWRDTSLGIARKIPHQNKRTIAGAGFGYIGTALLDRGLSKIGYDQESKFVRPAVLFVGSIGTQLAGQMLASKLMPLTNPTNPNTGAAA